MVTVCAPGTDVYTGELPVVVQLVANVSGLAFWQAVVVPVNVGAATLLLTTTVSVVASGLAQPNSLTHTKV